MFLGKSAFNWLSILLALTIITGCESGSSSNSAQDTSSFTLPKAIVQSKLSQTGTISAYLQVDGGTRQSMTVNGSSASVQLSLSTGSHQFKIILEFVLATDPGTIVTLGESSKTATIGSSGNNVNFADADFDFSLFDDDNDGISNLDEMLSVPTQISSVRTSGNTSTPILEYNSAGDGMAIWEVSNIGRSLVYSVYDSGTDSWSTEAILTSSTNSGAMTPQLVSNGTNYALVWRQYANSSYNLYSSFYDGSSWSTPAIIDTADSLPNAPVMASNGTGYAVAWYEDNGGQNHVLARISTDGSSWGSAVVIDNSTTGAYAPKIASNGTDYAVIWQQDSPTRIGVNISAAGVWSSGTAALLDNSSSYSASSPAIASNGSGFSVAWYKYDGTRNNVYSRTYYNAGGFSWSPRVDIDGSTNNAYVGNNPITSNGSGYAIAFSRYNGTAYDSYAVVNALGDASWGTPSVLESETASPNGAPVIASNGSTYATLWSQYDGSTTYDLFASVYNGTSWSGGAAIEAASSPIYSGFALARSGNGIQYVATWYQQVSNIYHVYANIYDAGSWGLVESLESGTSNTSAPSIEVNPSGGVTVAWSQTGSGVFTNKYASSSWGGDVALTTTSFGGSSYSPRLTSNGHGKTLALWRQYSGSNYNLYASIHENGAWSQPTVLSSGNIDTGYIHTASDGTGFAVTWVEYDGSYNSVYASIYDGSSWATPEEVDDSSISGAAVLNYNLYGSSLASNGTGYMLVYQQYDGSNYYDVYARAFDGTSWSTPQMLDLPAINNSTGLPSIVSNGTTYLAAWTHYDASYDAYASEYNGTSWSTADLIVDGSSTNYFYDIIRIAAIGSDYLAAWSQYDGASQYRAKANIYSAGSWSTPVNIDAGTATHQVYSDLSIVTGNTKTAVVWNEYNGTNYTVVANIVDGSSWAGPVIVDDASSGNANFDSYSDKSLTTNGDQFAIIWSRYDSGNSIYDAFASIYDGTTWSSATALESVDNNITNLQIASNGSGFLTAWIQTQGAGTILDIVGNQYDATNGWAGESVLDSDDNNSAFELQLYGTPDGYLATWTQAEPTGDPAVRFPWARIRF